MFTTGVLLSAPCPPRWRDQGHPVRVSLVSQARPALPFLSPSSPTLRTPLSLSVPGKQRRPQAGEARRLDPACRYTWGSRVRGRLWCFGDAGPALPPPPRPWGRLAGPAGTRAELGTLGPVLRAPGCIVAVLGVPEIGVRSFGTLPRLLSRAAGIPSPLTGEGGWEAGGRSAASRGRKRGDWEKLLEVG